jgi:hypothetical protein
MRDERLGETSALILRTPERLSDEGATSVVAQVQDLEGARYVEQE